MHNGLVTVFGGSGFVGRHVVRALVADGWRVRVATRRPHLSPELRVNGMVGQVQLVQANLRFPESVDAALDGADACVNLVALLHESGRQTFDALHVEGADAIATACANRGITNLAHISAIGADTASASDYARTKGDGEARIRDRVPSADILRPSIIFGEGDGFFTRFAAMANMAPALPLIGGGDTAFQPAYVGDVAKAVATVIRLGTTGTTYELAGPQTYSFKQLMRFTLDAIDRRRLLVPVPWFASGALGFMGEMSGALPFVTPFLTRDQVENLKVDNVASGDHPGFAALNIAPDTIEAIVPDYLERFRKYGQFHDTRSPAKYR
ncbi:complex I NDUFA9 subunit family protein [Algimonas porphyrae]|uniref:3-beta-hydroxy-Delta(5)-steroid dehydrogenase n=1 Tax=Algimonas porphyrae TaxID=1128113 RepID=A0ABQ5V0B0_9PROT|nr:complex I NDUFA9 subunit family protein [Algimonas porphyrae]GLQ20881.1 3-beta-hydroxy-Delta(5)-steroid dehydrogenase [Algimonas porphyrae]